MPQERTTLTPRRSGHEDGYVLVLVLGLMMVMMMILTTVVATSTSNLVQGSGYTSVSQVRAVADAGQAATNYALTEQVLPQISTTLKPYAVAFSGKNAKIEPIVPAAAYPLILTTFNALAAANTTGTVGSGNSAGTYTATTKFLNFRPDLGSFNQTSQTYYVDYTITSNAALGQFKRTVISTGTLAVTLGRPPLSKFLLLADDGGSTQGNYYTTGMNYDGPVQVNNNWQFYGSPIFLMGATTAAKTVGMYNCSSKQTVQVSTQSKDCTQPNWNGQGLLYGQPKATLPISAYSQAYAALGPDPTITASLNNATICTQLQLSNCTTPPNDVYLPNKDGYQGGIFVQGNATVNLSVPTLPANGQVYDITVGSVTTHIVVDYTAQTTTMSKYVAGTTTLVKGSSVVVQNRVPNGQLYVNGTITGIGGPARTGSLPNPVPTNSTPSQIPPAIARNSQLNISAASTVTVSSDITYQDDPRSVTNAKNVLGLQAGSGSVIVGTTAPNDVYIQGALIAGSSGSGLAAANYSGRPVSGSIHLLGSLAESLDPPRGVFQFSGNSLIPTAGYNDDFKYDQRFFNGTLAPPFFPTTTIFDAKTTWPTQSSWTEQ